MDIERSYDRRNFFREAFRLVGKNIAEYLDEKIEEKTSAIDLLNNQKLESKPEFKSKRKDYLRPPGAHLEALFLENCKDCNRCVTSCPRGAIAKAGSEYGEIAGTPIIIPRISPCVLCRDLSCTKACKSGVLASVGSINDVKMGLAEINIRNCPAYDGASNCSLCHIKCPLSDFAIYLNDFKPTINPKACTGCGVCEHACSTINKSPAIRVRARILEDVVADPCVRP